MNGDCAVDLASLTGTGQIFNSLDHRNWVNIPGQLARLIKE